MARSKWQNLSRVISLVAFSVERHYQNQTCEEMFSLRGFEAIVENENMTYSLYIDNNTILSMVSV